MYCYFSLNIISSISGIYQLSARVLPRGVKRGQFPPICLSWWLKRKSQVSRAQGMCFVWFGTLQKSLDFSAISVVGKMDFLKLPPNPQALLNRSEESNECFTKYYLIIQYYLFKFILDLKPLS